MIDEKNVDDVKKQRLETIVDITYLLGLASIYVTSLVLPLLGIAIAVILKTGGLTQRVKKIGNTCLVLGLIGIGLWLLVGIGIVVIAAAIFSTYGWYW